VAVENRADLRPIKTQYHVPADLEACHTAVIEGYAIEGHVPADVISRLLRERPKILGLAVPGMPAVDRETAGASVCTSPRDVRP
jgi:hypothetical protein